jgi:formylmethanofuran dehydrogenase subunit A
VQPYLPGQEVEIKVWTRIPHKEWVNLPILDPRILMLIGSRWRVLRRIR